MWRIASVVLCVLCIVAGSAAAYSGFEGDAFFVVDTGPGRAGAQAGDETLSSTQYVAAQFTLENDELVVSIEGWLGYLSIAGELPVEVWVFGDAGDVPDSTNVYWQQLFAVPSAGVVLPYPADWFGVYGISLDLDAGTYWVAFGQPTDDFGTGVMPPTTLQELDNYAFGNPTGGWTGDDTINIGVRIAVPEPNMLAQLGAGMFGLVVLHGHRRGRRQSQPRARRASPPLSGLGLLFTRTWGGLNRSQVSTGWR